MTEIPAPIVGVTALETLRLPKALPKPAGFLEPCLVQQD